METIEMDEIFYMADYNLPPVAYVLSENLSYQPFTQGGVQ
jgi:hypothetical protein